MPRTLILEPTRELAAQVEESFVKYGKNNKLSMALLIGGVSFDDQDAKLMRGVDVLIATPGRLLDHFERGRLLLTGVELLVIDEADRMLDMGFIPDIERICKLLPTMRQTLMFSATLPPEIKRLVEQFMMNPKTVSVSAPSSTSVNVAQHLVMVAERQKREVLRHLLRTRNVKNAYIFCNRKKDIGVLQRSLERHGFNAGALHGDMTQSARTATFEAFKADRLTLLVCSDVAARGLDVSDVSHVFNFDVPIHAEDYVHRIGRTGRAGKLGEAFTLATPYEDKFVHAIENMIKKPIPRFDMVGYTLGEEQASAVLKDVPETEGGAAAQPEAAQFQQRAERSERPRGERGPRRDDRPDNRRDSRRERGDNRSSRPTERGFRDNGRYDDNLDALPSDTNTFGDDVPAFLTRPARPAG